MDFEPSCTGDAGFAERHSNLTDLASSLHRHLAGHRSPAGIGPADTGWQAAHDRAEAAALALPLAALLARTVRFDAADPLWADRDRLVFSAGAVCLAEAASTLLGSGAGLFHTPAQILGVAAGIALAERMLAGRFGRSLVDHRCWVFGGGLALATGPVQEAASLAGGWRLGRLTMVVSVDAADAPGLAGFAAHGWTVRRAPAGDAAEIVGAISAALRSLKPTLIACVGACMPDAEVSAADAEAAWSAAGRRAAGSRRAWLKRLHRHSSRQDFDLALSGRQPIRWSQPGSEPQTHRPPEQMRASTAGTVRQALSDMILLTPGIVVLPAAPAWPPPAQQVEPANGRDSGAQLTQAIGAAVTGIAMHGGLVPAAAHCLNAASLVRPALGDAARAGLRMVQIMTEPLNPCPEAGQRAGLRAMRNLLVLRPADASEALECLDIAFRRERGPSVLLLSERAVPVLADRPSRTRAFSGGYVVVEPADERAVTLIASGPELRDAMDVRMLLAASGIAAAVVSLPCWTLFAAQGGERVAEVLGNAPRIGIEAGSGFGWDRWLGPSGLFISLAPLAGMPALEPSGIAAAVTRHLHGAVPNWTLRTAL